MAFQEGENQDDQSQAQDQSQGQSQAMPTFDPSQYPFLNDLAQGSSFDEMLANLDLGDGGEGESSDEGQSVA